MERINRVLAIHDISGFGKCSLTVALPVISACGIETTVMPTAVLSTHTGGFTGYTWRDLTGDMRPMADHWKSIDIGFDAIYSGYLGSFEQIEIVKSIVKDFKEENSFFLCDPAMADHGKMYALFDMDFAKKMAELCSVGVPTVKDIAKELQKPGRDSRDELVKPMLRSDIMDMNDLKEGMILDGTVRNVIDFGVFVDIGVHQDGLVHISEISDRFIRHPSEVLKVGDIVKVWVLSVDVAKKRISLTMRKDKL